MAASKFLGQRAAPGQAEHVDLIVTQFVDQTGDNTIKLAHRGGYRGAGLPPTPGASNAIVSRSVNCSRNGRNRSPVAPMPLMSINGMPAPRFSTDTRNR